MAKFAVILPAAGQSSRFRDREKKPFALLDGRAVWLRVAELFVTRDDVCQCLIVVAPGDQELFRRRYTANIAFLNVKIANGGAERFESIANALQMLPPEADFIAVHDAVRPCITEGLISSVFAEAVKTGAAIPGLPISDTVKQVDATTPVVIMSGFDRARATRRAKELGVDYVISKPFDIHDFLNTVKGLLLGRKRP